jgi:deoxyribodipyrimidine photolyase-like uncharacterized protein
MATQTWLHLFVDLETVQAAAVGKASGYADGGIAHKRTYLDGTTGRNRTAQYCQQPSLKWSTQHLWLRGVQMCPSLYTVQ